MFVADLHADSFLWGRNVLKHSRHGHVDMERLRHAGVDLQVFGVPSMTPLGRRGFDTGLKGADPRFYNPEVTARDTGGLKCTKVSSNLDTARLLYGQIGRPGGSARIIAFDQAKRYCNATDGTWTDNSCIYKPGREPNENKLFAVRTKADLHKLERAIAKSKKSGTAQPIGAMLGIEGVHWIKSDWSDKQISDEITALKNAGFGIIGLVHKFSNDLASSDEDCEQTYGLTPTGRRAFREIYEQDLILDLAHMSADTILSDRASHETALSLAKLPEFQARRWMIMSHGAIQTDACKSYRNLPPKHVAELLNSNILFGVIHWDRAFCLDLSSEKGWLSANRIEQSIIDTYWRAANELGVTPETAIRNLAIGADLDGAVNAPYDVRGFPLLLRRMSEASWCEKGEHCAEAVRKVAGQNVLKFLYEALPP